MSDRERNIKRKDGDPPGCYVPHKYTDHQPKDEDTHPLLKGYPPQSCSCEPCRKAERERGHPQEIAPVVPGEEFPHGAQHSPQEPVTTSGYWQVASTPTVPSVTTTGARDTDKEWPIVTTAGVRKWAHRGYIDLEFTHPHDAPVVRRSEPHVASVINNHYPASQLLYLAGPISGLGYGAANSAGHHHWSSRHRRRPRSSSMDGRRGSGVR